MPTFKTENFLFGAGKIYVDQFDASGNKQGERYVGNAPLLSVTTRAEIVTHLDQSEAIHAVDGMILTRIQRTGRMTLYNLSPENLAMFLGADVAGVTQSATPVTDESHTVKQGYYYRLGRNGGNPVGVRDVSAVTVTGPGGTPTYTATTDYVADTVAGMLYIVPGGAIADDSEILVDYTPAANWRQRVTSSTARFQGTLRFVPDNVTGDDAEFYATNVTMRPAGDVPFLGDDFASLTFELTFNEPDDVTLAALYIDGEPA